MSHNRRVFYFSSILIFMFILSSIGVASTMALSPATAYRENKTDQQISADLYEPVDTNPLNIKEQMTLSPMFTPDNALDIHAAWLRKAESTIDVQNQYIKKFDDRDDPWSQDSNPIVQELVAAAERGVQIRVQVREDSDTDNVAGYLDGISNINARYMGSSSNNPDDNYLSATHNKLVIIDSKITLISSINFGENAFLNNREAGMVVQNENVAQYFLKFFNTDWNDGETVEPVSPQDLGHSIVTENAVVPDQGESFTDIPRTNFSGEYNVSAYVNPDNADEHIFEYLASANESIYVSMYTISRVEFVDELIELKKENPAIDIQVLISRRRVGQSENVDTQEAALRLVDNLIPVYNSTDQLNFYHNKYWLIDQKHSFIYSGNWSPRSVTPVESDNEYTSGEANRDMGIAVHDAKDIADWIKTEVWDKDVAAAVPYELPIGVSQNSFEQSEVVSGTVSLSASVQKVNTSTVTYSFGSTTETVNLTDNAFSVDFDTTTIDNGITTFSVEITDSNGATYEDEVSVNVVNIPSDTNFRLLITEVNPNPEVVSDTEGEFIEVTNSFPFALVIEDWQVGDNNDLYTFDTGYEIPAYTSIIIARDPDGFESGYGVEADIELGFSLTNADDYVVLIDQAGEYVDVVAYGTDAPDGSESIAADFDEGQSISRISLHIDTDSASDFTFATPSPKANVPEVGLDEGAQDDIQTDLGDVSLPVFVLIVSLPVIALIRRKRQ